jgi:hypothetical protein
MLKSLPPPERLNLVDRHFSLFLSDPLDGAPKRLTSKEISQQLLANRLASRDLSDHANDVLRLLCGIDRTVLRDETALLKNKGLALGLICGVGDLEAIADSAVEIAEKGEGDLKFRGEGVLFGHGIHGDSGDFDSVGSK